MTTSVYTGNKNASYRLDPNPIAKGGEGSIHAIEGMPGHIAKLYLPNRLEGRASKLLFMSRQANAEQLKYIAWPYDVLKNASGQTVGFVMKRIGNTKDLSVLLPQTEGSIMTWRKRVRVAINLCDVVREVHSMGQCIGDMNPNNFGVDMSNGHVYAFDADSFHIRDTNGKYYPCVVKREEYCAPELQRLFVSGMDMRTISPSQTFTENTDRFALAVLIFQLLFNGFHPYSARPLHSAASSTIVTKRDMNILNGVTPYFNPSHNVTLLEDAPGLHIIPTTMQDLFRRAFLTQDRPSSAEWQRALFDLDGALTACPKDHRYWRGNSSCPWCALEKRQQERKAQPIPRPASKPAPQPAPRTVPQPTPAPQPSPVPQPAPQQPKMSPGARFFLILLLILLVLGMMNSFTEAEADTSPRQFVSQVLKNSRCTLNNPPIRRIEFDYGTYYNLTAENSGNGWAVEPYHDFRFWAASDTSIDSPLDKAAFRCDYSEVFGEPSSYIGNYTAFFMTFRKMLPPSERNEYNKLLSPSAIRSLPSFVDDRYDFGDWYCEITKYSDDFCIAFFREN